jgi:predicted ATPase with chaperone activity
LARALPGILPEMGIEESLDVTRIYSVADQLPAGTPLIKQRPFRAPYHTISHAGPVGKGNISKPGGGGRQNFGERGKISERREQWTHTKQAKGGKN